ncbi:dynein heavy chain 17, axonemal-like [Toxotes jaculatrix]|uniref:dynein heavy chain 17, axonemal-like n=1 Tax=Toxotes jaculatrix TaxID=941984 RepID=UPI001B3AD2FD|nr:dynein heavy chain 17, axonemal-like [Toxotes jaculatrix]
MDPVRSFTGTSLRLEEERWREFVSDEGNQVIFNRFFTARDTCHLFVYQDPDLGLSLSTAFPQNIQSKIICVSKTGLEAATAENSGPVLIFQETDDVLNFLICVTEKVTCPLLSNLESSSRWVAGVADETLRFMERQKNEALVMKAQIEGCTFLPYPDGLHSDAVGGTRIYEETENMAQWHKLAGNVSDMKLLHACDWTIIEWAELVSEFLRRDSSQAVLDGAKPLPSEEFHFWKNRLKNLLFIQQQLMSSRAQQVASIAQKAESVYWSTLRDIYRDVQEGVKEAEDVTLNLSPLEKKLEEVEQMEYQQLRDNMASVMEEVRLLWIRSEFYCKSFRMVVLLQKICNLFIHLSRMYLRGQEVMRGLLSDPGLVLDDVRLVVWTLQAFKQAYSRIRTQLEDRSQDTVSQRWDFPSHLVFFHLDSFLQRLQGIQEVFSVSLQLYQLDRVVLSGVRGRMWTDVVQDVYQDFLCHVTVLSDCNCDPTDPDDQSFELHLDQFQVPVSDLERRLVSVLSRALGNCSVSSSAAKLVSMFGFVLDRPLIRDQLHPHLIRLVEMVLTELDQTEQVFWSQREKSKTLGMFSPTAAAGLCWTQQLRLRAEHSLRSYRTFQHLCVDSGESQLVQQKFQHIVDLLQDFRDRVKSDWSSRLDSDCGYILEQPLIQINQRGILGVNSSHKLEAVLRELRYVSRERGTELRPHAARLFARRDYITQIYLNLSQMVSCYNKVLSHILQVELPLIQDQLQDLNQTVSALQRKTWGSEDVQQLVQQQTDKVLVLYSSVSEARANMDAMTLIIQGWAELCLLQRSGDSLLEGGATEHIHGRIREEGQELLRLTQVNRTLYRVPDSSASWIRYLDHIEDKVQDGVFKLLRRSLHFLCDSMNPQSCSGALLAVSLQLKETGSVFEPSVGDDLLMKIISDIHTAASLQPRISMGRHGNYQHSPELSELEREVMQRLLQVREEAERLRAGLDRYSHLWQSDRQEVFQEFLTYSRQLGPEELEADKTPPTLKDFRREIDSLYRLSREVAHLDEVIVLHGWLQVDLRPFRDSLLSLIHDWKSMYTEFLLDSVSDSLQKVCQRGDAADEESSPSSSFPLTETIILLEAAGVELPEHLSAQLQC